jgi:hypothetical protein
VVTGMSFFPAVLVPVQKLFSGGPSTHVLTRTAP